MPSLYCTRAKYYPGLDVTVHLALFNLAYFHRRLSPQDIFEKRRQLNKIPRICSYQITARIDRLRQLTNTQLYLRQSASFKDLRLQ